MITLRARGLRLLHISAQAGLTLILFWLWIFVAFGLFGIPDFHAERYFIYSVVVLLAFLFDIASQRQDEYNNLPHLGILRNHSLSLRQTAIVSGALLIFVVASKDYAISREFLFTLVPLLYCLYFFTNRHLPRPLARMVFRGSRKERTILLGSCGNARKLAPWLERKAVYGYEPVGLIADSDETDGGGEDDLPILGGLEDIPRILSEWQARQVILLDLPISPRQIADLGNLCDKLGVRLLIVNDLEDKLHRAVSFLEDDGFQFIGFRQEPLQCPAGQILKRMLDILIALPVVVCVLPFTNLLVWFLHRLQSPGPLFFRQQRSGLYNRTFSIWKYRTMHLAHDEESKQATEGDARIFAAGKWLRKLSIDELPQFINVLTGDMSIVGPRPHFVDHEALFGEIATFYRVRSFIKPGITGLAQVRGLRGEARKHQDIVDRIHSDIHYLENWSIVMDAVIILKTALQMLRPPKTAY